MAIAAVVQQAPVVRSVSTDTKTGSTPLSPGVPTGCTDGDLLIAVINEKGTGTSAAITAPTTQWGIVNSAAGDAAHGWVTVFSKVANGEATADFVFQHDADACVTVICINKYDTRAGFSFNVTASFAAQALGTTHIAPAITTLVPNTLMVCAFCEQTTGGTHATPSGMTEISDITVSGSTNQSVDVVIVPTAVATGTKSSVGVPNSTGMTVSLAIAPAPLTVSANYVASVQVPYFSTAQSLLIACIGANAQDASIDTACRVSSVTDDAHNIWQEAKSDFVTPLTTDPNVGVRTAIWYCEGAAAVRGITVTMTQNVDALGVEILEATGILGNSSLDVSASGHNNNTSGASAALTTLNAADLIVAVSAVGDSGVAFTHTGAFTALTDINQVSTVTAKDSLRVRADYKIVAATGAQSTSYAASPNAAQSWTIAAFKAGAFTATNPNPNWPALTQEAGFANSPNDPTSVLTWTDLVGRVTQFTTRRGRDYELARTEAGEADVHAYNVDGALDPSNGSSIYSPNIRVFTPYRMRATWNGLDYGVIQGFVERWPMKWTDQRGESRLQVVDAMATLAATRLNGSLSAEILIDNPWAYWPLNDGPLASKAANKAITTSDSLNPTTSTNLGGDGTFGAALVLQSEDSTCWQQTRTTASTADAPLAIYGTVLYAGMALPQLASGVLIECWAKISAATPTQVYTLLALKGTGFSSDSLHRIVNLYIDTGSGLPQVDVSDSSGTMQTYSASISALNDGSFHHYVVHVTTTTVKMWIDGLQALSSTLTSVPASTIDVLEVGGQVDAWANQNIAVGQFAHVAVFQLATADDRRIARRAQAGLTGFPELTGKRVNRLLNYAGWSAGRSIDPGLSLLGSAATISNQTILQALQDVASWENGNVFVDNLGNFRFMARDSIFNQVTKATFGDGTGEIPYTTTVEIDYDPQYIYNDVTVTQITSNFQTGAATSAGNAAHERDATSILQYFYRFQDKTTGVSSISQCANEAAWWLDNYAQPHMRLATITIEPSANPTLWPTALGLEIGDRVTVKRRPMGSGNVITLDCYVEQIAHKVSADELRWDTTFSLSPVRQSTYGGVTDWILNTSQLDNDTIVG